MALVSQNPGLPELTDDLGVNFAAVAALFVSPVERASVLVLAAPPKLSSPNDDVAAIAAPSPSESLTRFWREHPDLHSFFMISYSAFSVNKKASPTFSVQSVASTYAPGPYLLLPNSLQTWAGGKWQVIHIFDTKGVPLTAHSPTSKPRYFILK